MGRRRFIVCGAGHDGVVVSAWTEVAEFFPRCRDWAESPPRRISRAADLEIVLRVMVDFLERMAQQHAS